MAKMPKNGRILIIVTQADWGGVQQYIVKAAQEAVRRGFDVLVAYGGIGDLPDKCAESGIASRALLHLVRPLAPIRDIQGIREIRALIREWKPDTVYLHSSKAGVLGSIAAHREDVPRIVYRIGGWSFLDPVSPLQKTLRLWMEKLTAPLKDVIIVVHPGDAELANRLGIKAREMIATIPNGIGVETFERRLLPREEARNALHNLWEADAAASRNRDTAHIILTIANFYPTKDLFGYMEAIKLIRNKRDLRFLIVGDGDERRMLETKRRELGLEDRVSLPGKRNDIASLLRGADIFVLPSAKEGMPWTLLEAMAASVPCIATNVGANRWMLGDAGIIVPPKTPKALADAIEDTIHQPEKSVTLGKAGRRQVQNRFQERRMWDDTFRALALKHGIA